MARDYYEILGVPKGASADDLKKVNDALLFVLTKSLGKFIPAKAGTHVRRLADG